MNIIEEIKHYIAEPNTIGALLITGKWGCGKTYLIEHELCSDEEVIKKYHILRISLFGEESAISITRKVKRRMMSAFRLVNLPTEKRRKRTRISKAATDKNGNSINKIVNVLKVASNIAGAFTQVGNAINAIASVDVTEFFECKNEINNKKVVLVFDDFERSRLQHDDLLGCINEFVETYEIKTIIIANEEKIDIDRSDDSSEGKKQSTDDKDEDKDKKHLDKERKISKYLELKEKVVSRTVKLIPNYRKIIDQIVRGTKCKVDTYKTFLEAHISLIESIFIESLTDNIRSLKCALQDFERIYQIAIANDIPEESIVSFFAVFLGLSFEYKLGALNMDEKYGNIFLLTDLPKKYAEFQSSYAINGYFNWIVEGVWEEQAITNEVRAIGKDRMSLTPSELLLVSPVVTLTDEQLNLGFEEALAKGYSGDLMLREYDDLLVKIANCNNLQLAIQKNIDASELMKGVNSRFEKIVAGELEDEPRHIFFDNFVIDNLLDEQKQVLSILEKFEAEKYQRKYKYKFLKAFQDCRIDEINDINTVKNYYFDEEMANAVFAFYLSSNQISRYNFLRYFVSKYNNAFFTKDEDRAMCHKNLEFLRTKVLGIEREQATEKALDNLFIKDISEIIQKQAMVLTERS